MGVSCLGSLVRTDTVGPSQCPLTDFMSCACFVGIKKTEGHWLVVGSRGWRRAERKCCWKLSDWRHKVLHFSVFLLRARFVFFFLPNVRLYFSYSRERVFHIPTARRSYGHWDIGAIKPYTFPPTSQLHELTLCLSECEIRRGDFVYFRKVWPPKTTNREIKKCGVWITMAWAGTA
jgi:hypothetical protein